MKAVIGAYVIEHIGFNTIDEAVAHVRNLYPELGEERVRKSVKSLVLKDADKSGNIEAKAAKGDTERTDVRKGSPGRKQS